MYSLAKKVLPRPDSSVRGEASHLWQLSRTDCGSVVPLAALILVLLLFPYRDLFIRTQITETAR